MGHGLACKGVHEELVTLQHSIFQVSARAVSAAPRNVFIGPLFLITLGALFAWFGYSADGSTSPFLLFVGCLFFVYGCITFIRNRAIYSGTRA
jgi:hypothetical protein